jgi:CBS domain-containing protein
MDKLTARDVMTAEVYSVRADTPLGDVAQLLAVRHISGVPVIDEREQVIGIVSEADLIDEEKRQTQIPRTALFGFFPVPDDVLQDTYRRGMELKARDVMTKRVYTASEETPLPELAEMMLTGRINRVPVVREGRLVGIVSRGDIVRALAGRGAETGRKYG